MAETALTELPADKAERYAVLRLREHFTNWT